MSEYCPTCGARMKKWWHALTPGLVKTLVKIYKAIESKKENKIHPHKEMTLATAEHMNMTKLRFHGLIAKYREGGEVERGYWLITKRGSEFLKGQIDIPHKVQTFRNRVVDHSPDTVTIKDVMRSVPYWEQEFDYDLFEPHQKSLL